MIKKLIQAFQRRAAGPSASDAASTPAADPAANPTAVASFIDRNDGPRGRAAAHGEGTYPTELEEFRASFCHRPGVNFWKLLKQDGVTRMMDWFGPETPEPEPKALVRLALDMMQRGESFQDQPCVAMLVQVLPSNGGKPSQLSQDALSVFAQITGKPVVVYYEPQPEAPMMVMRFEP